MKTITHWRACYYVSADGQYDMVMTGPEHAHLTDDELVEEALAEADRAGLIGEDDESHTPRDLFEKQLRIGEWMESTAFDYDG